MTTAATAAGGTTALAMVRACTFRLGRDCFAIEAARVTEVIRGGRLTRVPRAPAVVLGLVHLRGRIVPVIDLAALLGVESTGGTTGVHLVVRLGADSYGLLVDEMLDVVDIPAHRIERPAERDAGDAGRDPRTGVFAAEKRLVHLLDPEAIIQTIPHGPGPHGPAAFPGARG
jgi:purine-binding chemotaxis protein CheW